LGSWPPNALAASTSEIANRNWPSAISRKSLIFGRLVESAAVRISEAGFGAESSE
jgi:hypothetical protein